MTTNRIRLACPDCFSDPGSPCERCGGKGTINAVLPDGGAPLEMQKLFADRAAERAREKKMLTLVLSVFVTLAVLAIAIFADRIF